jgi:hypothetical protein
VVCARYTVHLEICKANLLFNWLLEEGLQMISHNVSYCKLPLTMQVFLSSMELVAYFCNCHYLNFFSPSLSIRQPVYIKKLTFPDSSSHRLYIRRLHIHELFPKIIISIFKAIIWFITQMFMNHHDNNLQGTLDSLNINGDKQIQDTWVH